MKLTIVIIGIILAAGCATAVPSYYGYRPYKDTCKPRLLWPYEKYGSVIELYQPRMAQVAAIVDYGTCTISNTGFYWAIDWGDNTAKSTGVSSHIRPFGPIIHEYSPDFCYYHRHVKVTVIHCHKKIDKLRCDKIWKILYFKKYY